MDKQFLNLLHKLNRRDELRSRLIIEGLKHSLKRELSSVRRFLFNIKKRQFVAKGW